MTDKVQKVREKVEKLKSNLMYGACSSQVAMDTRCKEKAYNEVLAILDSMQEEPKECIYSKDNYTDKDRKVLCEGCEEECKYAKKEPVNEDLEEAAQEYTEKGSKCQEELDAFKAGAKWQKQVMMKEAVDGGCFSYRNGYKHISCDIDENLTNIKLGDKVKLIIIKEE